MTMKPGKQKKLEKAGWKVGSTDEFLSLSPEESAYIDMKLALCDSVKSRRMEKRLSQNEFAKLISSSQSRVAKIEAGDPSVSLRSDNEISIESWRFQKRRGKAACSQQIICLEEKGTDLFLLCLRGHNPEK